MAQRPTGPRRGRLRQPGNRPSAPPRASISQGRSGLEIVLPRRASPGAAVFLVAWLAGWYFGASRVIGDLAEEGLGRDSVMPLLWLAIWSLGGIAALLALLGSFGGEERMTVSATETHHNIRSRFWRDRTRSFRTPRILNLRTTGRGVSFDYDGEPVHVLKQAGPEDAGRIVAELLSRYPHMDPARS